MNGQLLPCGGGDPISLLKDSLLVGRRSRCDITLRFANVSSHHCQLEFINGYWRVRDLGSSNGVKVNGEPCQTKWLLPGDVVAVARHEFEIEYEPQSDEGPPEEENPFEMSLMEKAGLERPQKRRRPTPEAKPEPGPVAKDAAVDDDDAVLGWLTDDD